MKPQQRRMLSAGGFTSSGLRWACPLPAGLNADMPEVVRAVARAGLQPRSRHWLPRSDLFIHLEYFNSSATFLCWKLCRVHYASSFVGLLSSGFSVYWRPSHCSPSAVLAPVRYFMVLTGVCKCLWKVLVTLLLVSAWALMHSSWLRRL